MIQLEHWLTVIFSMLAAWAWLKSALLQMGKQKPNWLDDLLNRISTNSAVWNAIAAGLAAAAAIFQTRLYLAAYPVR